MNEIFAKCVSAEAPWDPFPSRELRERFKSGEQAGGVMPLSVTRYNFSLKLSYRLIKITDIGKARLQVGRKGRRKSIKLTGEIVIKATSDASGTLSVYPGAFSVRSERIKIPLGDICVYFCALIGY